MTKQKIYPTLPLLAMFMAVFVAAAPQSWADTETTYSTPPGIVLVAVYQTYRGTPDRVWTRLGDSEGRTLFVSDTDTENQSACTGDCAREFPPVLALPGSRESAQWKLVKREEGLQWAYQGKPLYTFARETRLNEVLDNVMEAQEKDERAIVKVKPKNPLLAPEGWHIARYNPGQGMQLPANIQIEEVAAAASAALTDKDGFTLYSFVDKAAKDDDAARPCEQCGDQWIPVQAGQLSREFGDFTLIDLDDGRRQWVFRGAPLYRFSGDQLPGEINGIMAPVKDGLKWRVVDIEKHFVPAGVTVRDEVSLGYIFATDKGMPIYSRDVLPRALLASSATYVKGKTLGTLGCDEQCLSEWLPMVAPADAQPQGYWEIVERDNGVRQWTYMGYAQYLNSQDSPGANTIASGDSLYDLVVGDKGRYTVADATRAKGSGPFAGTTGGGFFWRASKPNGENIGTR